MGECNWQMITFSPSSTLLLQLWHRVISRESKLKGVTITMEIALFYSVLYNRVYILKVFMC